MPVDIASWMAELGEKLAAAFGARLLFLGLKGSYRRGEATDESDINTVAVLDTVSLEDLSCYRILIASMPHGTLACSVLCGRVELISWPRYSLLQLVLDTKPWLGNLSGIVPHFFAEDVDQAIRANASRLYHMAVHSFLRYEDQAKAPRALAVSALFLLRLQVWRNTERWCVTKDELRTFLPENELPLLNADHDTQTWYTLLLSLSSKLMGH